MTTSEDIIKAANEGYDPNEHTDLTSQDDGDETPAENLPASGKKNQAAKGDTITVSKKDMSELLARLSALESDRDAQASEKLGVPQSVFKRKKDRLVRVRKWDDKYVVGYTAKGAYDVFNSQTREKELFIDILLHGKKEPVQVKLVDFLNDSVREYAKVTNIDMEEEVENFGAVNSKEEKDGRFIETDDLVPLDVQYEHRTYTVQTQDGTELVLNELFINQ